MAQEATKRADEERERIRLQMEIEEQEADMLRMLAEQETQRIEADRRAKEAAEV